MRGSIVQSVREPGDRCGACSPHRRRSSEAAVEYLDASSSWKSQGSQQNYQQMATTYPASSSTQWDSQGQGTQWKPSQGYQQQQNYNQNYNQNYQKKQGYHGSYQNKTWKG